MHSPEWRLKSFEELTTHELYAILALRQEVFVVEQRCAYRDADGLDVQARHLFAVDAVAADGTLTLAAVARLFAPGVRGDEAVIGRVVTAPAQRRGGLGRALMTRAIAAAGEHTPIRIGAQSYLERFYRSLGFTRAGADYLEDDIPHLPMIRRGP